MSNEDISQEQQIDDLAIGQLRKLASLMQIKAEKTWDKEEFIARIKAKQADLGEVSIVMDGIDTPAPGRARILIHRDPTPSHKNSPITLGVNGRLVSIPRGLEVDVPIPFVEVLKNAISLNNVEVANPSRDNPSGLFKEEKQTSYPFQVIAITPGKFENQYDSRSRKYVLREAFYKKYGAWPTSGELKEYQKANMSHDLNK